MKATKFDIQLKKYILYFLLIFLGFDSFGQNIQEKIENKRNELDALVKQEEDIKLEIESLQFLYINERLNYFGIPISKDSLEVVKHNAMFLGYFEKHEQASWVSHLILPDIISGNVSRSNDFRKDPFVSTGTSVKEDYWYSGYDRGHLAPSADFKWSKQALSETYYYSNMSPQKPELNRERWAQLEGVLRDYVIENVRELYVITGPVLHDSLSIMMNEGRKNDVSIPEFYYKIAVDLRADPPLGIAFLMPNGKCAYPVMNYATSIDKIEEITGLDFLPNLPEDIEQMIESNTNAEPFKTGSAEGEVEPINPTTLPKGKINTVQAKYNSGSKSCVCGTVVSTKYSEKSGATFLNLDKKFPNQIFSVTIWKDSRSNFSYKIEDELYNKKVCITGIPQLKDGIATMNVTNEDQIEIIEETEDENN
jgi:endonuclease G, mitochondrial